jgi:hypothetical protein
MGGVAQDSDGSKPGGGVMLDSFLILIIDNRDGRSPSARKVKSMKELGDHNVYSDDGAGRAGGAMGCRFFISIFGAIGKRDIAHYL